jgi:transposase
LVIDSRPKLMYPDGMSDEQVPLGISAEDWAATPVSVRELLCSLLAAVEQHCQRIADLEERLNKTSRNSSKPPSSDLPSAPPRPRRTPSGRKPGGQKGHVGRGRSLKPLKQVSRVVDVKPDCCTECGALLLGEDPAPVRHQVSELPRIEPKVTEYRRHTLTCLACGKQTAADWPVKMPPGSFGPRLQATVGYFTGRLGVSQRDVEEVMDTVFHTEVSLGSVPALEQKVSAALAKPVEQAHEYVEQQPVVNADETGWREGTQRRWLWVAATPLVTVFLLMATRGAEGAKRLLGEAFQGILGSDRWSAYNWLDALRRQLCWAHLKRDFQAFIDRGGESARIGQALLEQMFDLWHRVRNGPLSRADFQEAMEPIQQRVGELLREGAALPHDKTRHTCENILKLERAVWTFVSVEGVEPTNNNAERPLRRAVLWRRRSFGTQSTAGSRFVERVLTTVITLRQQKRDVLDYLTEACAAAIRGDEAPSLLPNQHAAHSAA